MVKHFLANTGMLGSTEPGQRIEKSDLFALPPGTVVRNGDGSKLIHLHTNLWLYLDSNAWCYDTFQNLGRYVDEGAILEHLPMSVKIENKL